ncbi:MAG: hypothetical protein QM813_08320 [Verrucomicrobiota bacterium]
MLKLKTALTLLLAILWLPVTSHCLLFEAAEGTNSPACCLHDDAPVAESHHQQEGASAACALLENAQYKSSQQRIAAPPFVAQLAFELPSLLNVALISGTSDSQQLDTPLESLPVTWQFSMRAALPARAPSFVS